MLATQWNLPTDFVTLISQHTRLNELLADGQCDPGAACVALASLLPSCVDQGWVEREEFIDGFSALTGRTVDDLESIFAEVDEGTNEFAPILKLPAPKAALVDLL